MSTPVVRLYDGGICIENCPPGLLDSFRYTHRTAEKTRGRTRWISTKIDLFAEHAPGVILTYPGFIDRVFNHLNVYFPDAVIHDSRTPLPEPEYDNLSSLIGRQDEALAMLLSHHNGILKMPTGSGKSFLIGQLIRVFPTQKILITTPQLSILDDLFRRCCTAVEDLGVCVGMFSSKVRTDSQKLAKVPARRRTEPTVMVMSTGSLGSLEPDWPDILLFDEVHEAATGSRSPLLVPFLGCRMYGFSATPFGRPDGSDTETEALFGPVRYCVEYQEGVTADMVVPIRVTMLRVTLPDFPEYQMEHQQQRFGYWLNRVRNETAVQYVRSTFSDESQVLFLVRTVEHAAALQALTGYEICYSSITPSAWYSLWKNGYRKFYTEDEQQAAIDWMKAQKDADPPREFRNLQTGLRTAFVEGAVPCAAFQKECRGNVNALKDKFREGHIRRLIATTVFKQGVDFPHLTCLVRMDGMSGSIPSLQMGGRVSRKDDGKHIGEVVDFLDDYGDLYLGKSITREKEYRKVGWDIQQM